MAFDIHQPVFAEAPDDAQETATEPEAEATPGGPSAPEAERRAHYQAALLAEFAASPEWQALDAGATPVWAAHLLDAALDGLRVTPPQLTPDQLRDILFTRFPRDVARPAAEAPAAIQELRAFWEFLGRAYALPNAAELRAVLDDKAARRFEIAMSNPAHYGPDKAMLLAGMARGADVSTEEGRRRWAATYAGEQATRSMLPFSGLGGGMGLPDPGALAGAAAESGPGLPTGGGTHRKPPSRALEKSKRKMAKASQRKNRKK